MNVVQHFRTSICCYMNECDTNASISVVGTTASFTTTPPQRHSIPLCLHTELNKVDLALPPQLLWTKGNASELHRTQFTRRTREISSDEGIATSPASDTRLVHYRLVLNCGVPVVQRYSGGSFTRDLACSSWHLCLMSYAQSALHRKRHP